jgi:choline dehydrogenase
VTGSFDHVIVGGGSAGSVLANRLSADPARRVLVLEGGRPDQSWDVLGRAFARGPGRSDWRHRTEPEPGLLGRRLNLPADRVPGGISSLRGMLHQRGNPLDYDGWATQPGLQRWGFAHLLPYFKRMEDAEVPGPLRGRGGPLTVAKARPANVLAQAFLLAAQEAGHHATPDVNGYRQEGFGALDHNVRRFRRWSATRGYLRPAMDRANLTVGTGTTVTKIVFRGTRAVGVEFADRRGRVHRVLSRDTILCAGAIKSPHILQLSGVGDAAFLESVGVPVVHHLPGVGANLQDHLVVRIQHSCSKPVSLRSAANPSDAGGFARSNDDLAFPNLAYEFLPVASKSCPTSPTGPYGFQVQVGVTRSGSRGSVRLASPSWRTPPAIRFGHLSTEQDRRDWVDAIRVTRQIMGQSALARYDGGEVAPGPDVRSDDRIWDWVVGHAESAMHYAGSCRLGTDDRAVVDPDTMEVHGLDGVRVVDASVMPVVTNAGTYAPVMMIAEKAADLVLDRPPLPPDHTEYFRRDHTRAIEMRVATPE